jgi:hypothetical protein
MGGAGEGCRGAALDVPERSRFVLPTVADQERFDGRDSRRFSSSTSRSRKPNPL